VDPNSVIFESPLENITSGEVTLDMYYREKFHVINGITGMARSSHAKGYDKVAYQYQLNKLNVYEHLSIRKLLSFIGVPVHDSRGDLDMDSKTLDLSPGVICKSDLINLFAD
jgi:hypothetical protein